MRKYLLISVTLAFVFFSEQALAWGIWGHNHINKGAILALPPEMGMFFYNHSDFITEESTVPDLRKYTLNDKAEHCRHYINLERFNYSGRKSMPPTLHDAISKYGMDSLNRWGILPWYIQDMTDKLTVAFRDKRKTEILLLAADLGHYVSDGHMPLHTTIHHDGASPEQKGVHAFWEAQLPEIFGKNYNLNAGNAQYVRSVEHAAWDIVDSSHTLVKKLLHSEEKLRRDNPLDKQFVIDSVTGKPLKNKFGSSVHAYSYCVVYNGLLDGMVERQMRSAIRMTASLWYTAWVNAGKPDLSDLDPGYVTDRNKALYKQDIKAWQKGKVRGCKSEKEYPNLK